METTIMCYIVDFSGIRDNGKEHGNYCRVWASHVAVLATALLFEVRGKDRHLQTRALTPNPTP